MIQKELFFLRYSISRSNFEYLSIVIFSIKSRDAQGNEITEDYGENKHSFAILPEFAYIFVIPSMYIYIYSFLSPSHLSARRTDAEASRRIIGLPMAAVRGAWRGLDN